MNTRVMLVLLCIIGGTVEEHRVHAAQRREAAAALAMTNAIAERDSTRDVARGSARVAALAAESIRVFEKRAVQAAQRSDALDRALGGERKARYELVARVDSLAHVAPAAAHQDAGTRRASFAVREPPYTVTADVEMPPPPDSATMSVRVRLDSIVMEARLHCSVPDVHGVRSASLAVTTPRWAAVRLGRLEQSPDVCVPAASRVSRPPRIAVRWPLVGVGVVGVGRGQATLGYFVGAGLVFRP